MGGIGSGGHNAKSVTEHRTSGTFRADRHDKRRLFDGAERSLVAPDYLCNQARQHWQWIMESYSEGYFVTADTPLLVQACELWAAYRKAVTDGQVRLAGTLSTKYLAVASKTGLGPVMRAQRSGVQDEVADQNEFEKFLQEASGG